MMAGFSYFRPMQITWKFKAFNKLTIDELYAMMVIRHVSMKKWKD